MGLRLMGRGKRKERKYLEIFFVGGLEGSGFLNSAGIYLITGASQGL